MMLKLISSTVGLIAVVMSIAPNAQAMTTNINPAVGQPAPDLHAQVIFQIGTPVYRPVYDPGYYFGWELYQREREREHRRFEREREREREHRRFEREREHDRPGTEYRRDYFR